MTKRLLRWWRRAKVALEAKDVADYGRKHPEQCAICGYHAVKVRMGLAVGEPDPHPCSEKWARWRLKL